jgi:hypothetical protein
VTLDVFEREVGIGPGERRALRGVSERVGADEMVALDRRAARLCLRAQQASRPHHRSECGPCGGRSWNRSRRGKTCHQKKTSAPSIRAVIAAVTAAGYRASGVSARISTPTLAAVSLAVSGFFPSKIERHLTRHRKQPPHSAPNMGFSASVASVTAVAHSRTASRSTSPAARDLIDLGDGKQHRFDGASADSVPGMQGLRLAKLLGKVGEALINCQFSPPALSARPRPARPHRSLTRPCRAPTIPMWKTSARQ